MKIFFDSSAFAKRYISEHGSANVIQRCFDATHVILSVLCPIEILSGFNRLRREGKMSLAEYKKLKVTLAEDLAHAHIVPLGSDVVKFASHCLEKSPLRALDAIHVASAQASQCNLFLSADRQQTLAAALAGLEVELIV